MRILGLLLIILAHVQPPSIVFQLRTFDVPMMVFVSGMAYYCSGKVGVKFIPYSISRFTRLVFPVWVFLLIFFACIFIFKPLYFLDLLTLKNMVSTFLLGGFGYVWIIKVFLIIAICSPLYVRFVQNKNGYSVAFITLAMLLFSFIIFQISLSFHNRFLAHFLSDLFFPAIVYGAVFILGYKVLSFNLKESKFIFVLYLITFVICFVSAYFVFGKFVGPQYFKYPPSIFYISYSLVAIFLVKWFFELTINTCNLPFVFKFISSNTIWIYLWHIPIVEYFHRYNVDVNFIFKYAIAVVLPVAITLIQVFWVKKTGSATLNKIFTG